MALEVEFNPSQFNNVLGGRRLEYVSKLSDIKTNCYTAMLNTMCVRSGTRIIHMLTILSVLSVIVFGKNCEIVIVMKRASPTPTVASFQLTRPSLMAPPAHIPG